MKGLEGCIECRWHSLGSRRAAVMASACARHGCFQWIHCRTQLSLLPMKALCWSRGKKWDAKSIREKTPITTTAPHPSVPLERVRGVWGEVQPGKSGGEKVLVYFNCQWTNSFTHSPHSYSSQFLPLSFLGRASVWVGVC